MSIKKLIILFFLLFVFGTSCTDHDISTGNKCKFKGISSHAIQKYYSTITTEDYDSDWSQNDDDLPASFTSIRITTNMDSTLSSPPFISTVTDNRNIKFEYNSDGFLTRIVQNTITLQQGGRFLFENYPIYTQGRIEENNITSYEYKNGLLQKLNNDVTTTFKNEKLGPISKVTHSEKRYQYNLDDKGGVQKMIETSESGEQEISTFSGENLLLRTTLNKNGIVTVTQYYNEKGQLISQNSSGIEVKYQYDNNGNNLFVKLFYNGNINQQSEYLYDNHPNPIRLISTKFKGIRITTPLNILLSSDSFNNLTYSNLINFQSNMSYQYDNDYKYNASNYPETSTSVSNSNNTIFSSETAYKYQDCK